MASRIRNDQGSRLWPARWMFLDWFGWHRSQRDRLRRCWWRSIQWKRGGITEWRKGRTECINVSPASLCIITESFSQRYIMGELWAVACEYRLINRCIAGAMKLLARYINFSCVRANSPRMLLHSALSQGQVSLCQKTTNKFKSWWKLLSMAADVKWTTH